MVKLLKASCVVSRDRSTMSPIQRLQQGLDKGVQRKKKKGTLLSSCKNVSQQLLLAVGLVSIDTSGFVKSQLR